MKRFAFTLATLAIAAAAHAQVIVKDAWVRATVPQQKATGAFMQLTAAQDAKLVAGSSPVAGVVEIHEMVMDNNVMKMREVSGGLALPAGKAVDLKPGGYHVMLMDLKGQVKDGDVVPVSLVFEGKDDKKQTVEIKATARPLNTAAKTDASQGGHAGMKH